jgi:hypothetical protein
MNQKDRLLSFDNISQKIYRHNQKGRRGKYYSQAGGAVNTQDITVEIIFNEGSDISKKFFSLNWVTKFRNSSNVIQTGVTFADIICSNDIETLGTVALTPFVSLTAIGNTRNVKGTWNFNSLKNSSNNLLTDKYLSVTLSYRGENSVSLYDVESVFRIIDKS